MTHLFIAWYSTNAYQLASCSRNTVLFVTNISDIFSTLTLASSWLKILSNEPILTRPTSLKPKLSSLMVLFILQSIGDACSGWSNSKYHRFHEVPIKNGCRRVQLDSPDRAICSEHTGTRCVVISDLVITQDNYFLQHDANWQGITVYKLNADVEHV